MVWRQKSWGREGSCVVLEGGKLWDIPHLRGAGSCFEQCSAKSSSSGQAVWLAWSRAIRGSFSLTEAGNMEEVANLGGRFSPVPPTLLTVGVANQTPCLAPFFSVLLHIHSLFFLSPVAARSVPEAAKFRIKKMRVRTRLDARYRIGKGSCKTQCGIVVKCPIALLWNWEQEITLGEHFPSPKLNVSLFLYILQTQLWLYCLLSEFGGELINIFY